MLIIWYTIIYSFEIGVIWVTYLVKTGLKFFIDQHYTVYSILNRKPKMIKMLHEYNIIIYNITYIMLYSCLYLILLYNNIDV